MELHKLTVHEARDLLNKREISSQELTESVLEQVDRVEKHVNAFITMTAESALEEANKADMDIAKRENVSDLTGIPYGLKDNICTQNIRTTCGSRMLENFAPPYDATVIKRIKAQNGVLLGKLNMDEFAMGSSTETSFFHKTYNPWDLTRVPGGSSGGAAASVAADEVFYALGSDTGGSIRQPAAFCGVVGLKPTYGRVSRFGIVSFASSFDQVGPIAKDVTDCALILKAIAGYDQADPTLAKTHPPDYSKALVDDVKGMRIGIPKEYFDQNLDSTVKETILKALEVLEGLGAHVEEISLPYTDYAMATYFILVSAEASSNLARFDGIKYGYRAENYQDLEELYLKTRSEGFGTEVKRRILLGNYFLSSDNYETYYVKAQNTRTLIIQDFDRVFNKMDIIVAPTCATTAFQFGEKVDDPIKMYLSDKYTVPANIAGLPAISLPCGFDGDGLPIGMQFIGKAFDESTLLKVAFTFEQNTDYHIKRPAINWR